MLRESKMGKEGSVNFLTSDFASMAINHNCTNRDKGTWIVDTGASNHICTNQALFDDLVDMSTPITVYLPDGSTNQVTQMGNIFFHGLKIIEALFWPDFSHNLNKLITTNQIFCTFYPCFCIL